MDMAYKHDEILENMRDLMITDFDKIKGKINSDDDIDNKKN